MQNYLKSQVHQNTYLQIFQQVYIIKKMSKANSFKSQPWTQLEKGNYSVFEDDFISNKLSFKFTKKTSISTITLKESFQLQNQKLFENQEELKLWFPFRDTHTIYLRLKNEAFKIHYDNGVKQRKGYKFNWYGSWQSKHDFTADSYKVGVELKNQNWSTNFRVACKPVDLGLYLYNKTLITQNKWNLGLVNVFQPFTNEWLHSAFQIGWQNNSGNDFYLRGNTGKKYIKAKPINYLNDIVFDYIHKYNPNNNLGFELRGNLFSKQLRNVSLVWDHKCESSDNTGIKLKVDNNRNLAVSVTNSISGFGNYNLGVNIQNLGGLNRFTYGISLDLDL